MITFKQLREQDEPASPDEKDMAMKQAEFIGYVAREIGEHLKANKEFPEWMQNKLSALHEKAKSFHASLGAHGPEDMEEARDPNDAFMRDQGGSGNSAARGQVKKLKGQGWWAKNKSGTQKIFDKESAAKKFAASRDMGEKLDPKKHDMGDYIKDFQKSDAPQFKGASKEKRRKMAIAAYLDDTGQSKK